MDRASQRSRRNDEGAKIVRVQSARAGFIGPSYRMPLPAPLARLIGPDVEFTVELTEEGILYRKVGGQSSASALPEWLREEVIG